ncbi:MAG: CinA family protein, partial [Oceanococcaceae bacterium]
VCADITAQPGASKWFAGGLVAYTDGLKQGWLGVPADRIARFGAVSAEVVQSLLEGAPEEFAWVWAESGIYGPGGARPGKPVGTIWTGVRLPDGRMLTERLQMSGSREQMRRDITARAACGLSEHMSLSTGR